ncbi:MAG: riboflavin synthase [Kordiimonadaceae bacterium]|nr:riboflavin synthase [Kordiimonadaceae bacterium]
MFTGIITDVGTVRSIEGDSDLRIAITTGFDTSTIDIGASIACSGVCLTVVDKGEDWFSADVSNASLQVTNLSGWKKGSLVNLERALKLGEELGGHIVTGHVDAVGNIETFKPSGDSMLLEIAVSADIGKHIAQKGSVTVDGVSLTVNDVTDTDTTTVFSLNIIPHTQDATAFRTNVVGDKMNIEFDILARYVARLQERG